jgi:uncharacterized protein (TIGR01244 family)
MIEDIRNYLALTETLSSSGMPNPEQLAAVAAAGTKVVINLAPHTAAGATSNEKGLVEALGMAYFNIPVDWNNPTRADLDEFMDVMEAHKESTVLVHCQANFRATGFITMYRILKLGWTREDAFQDLQRIWNPRNYSVWHKFIEQNLDSEK